jgi:4-alpha-glucanotransferase
MVCSFILIIDTLASSKKSTVQNDQQKKAPVKKVAKKNSRSAKTILKEEKKPIRRKTASKEKAASATDLLISFQLRFQTRFGQLLFMVGDHPLLGNNDPEKAIPLQYLNDAYWQVTLNVSANDLSASPVQYRYILVNEDGTSSYDVDQDRFLDLQHNTAREIQFIDQWNYAGFHENIFATAPFRNVLLAGNRSSQSQQEKLPKSFTHRFHAKAPLLKKDQTLCLIGSDPMLGNWNTSKALVMQRNGDHGFICSIDLSAANFPIAYKYAIWDTSTNTFSEYEQGDNRLLQYPGIAKQKTVILHDGFARFPNQQWKGAGVAIPVFSLRSQEGLGVGEFTDIKALANWAANTGLKLIQLLPVNDTSATLSWHDSYPYAAISAFALHPIYLNVITLAQSQKSLLKLLEKERVQLNQSPVVDYTAVLAVKLKALRTIYKKQGKKVLSGQDFIHFYNQHQDWLKPYAVFCCLRDEYGTAHFNQWPADTRYTASLADQYAVDHKDAVDFYYFMQYQLHCQLKEATDHARSKGVVVKGDIAIGVYRYSVDAWQHPHLFHMDQQAGAPPDDFAVAGQNWGFPTYNWQEMQANGFDWWQQRFAQMAHYFDAFRIDHILGFFRIWSIPLHAVEGIMGHFVPAIPVHINEFQAKGISFDHHRFTQPFITDQVLWEIFGNDQDLVISEFLQQGNDGDYQLLPDFNTQRKVADHFAQLEQDELHQRIQQGLYQLISNVLLFPDEQRSTELFHFRFHMDRTSSFRFLQGHVQDRMRELYQDYFFQRQDASWKMEAMKKLPPLKLATDMLVCGEDLGLVPACVPEVMAQLGILSLEIQRMPKQFGIRMFHPAQTPYLSVITPSTHDMSTLREWWEEDMEQTRWYYQHILGQWGDPPLQGDEWIMKAIVIQHLHAPAMWSIFQLQDLLAMDKDLRRDDPLQERINVPANAQHYWQYRMHLNLEELSAAEKFNRLLAGLIHEAKR